MAPKLFQAVSILRRLGLKGIAFRLNEKARRFCLGIQDKYKPTYALDSSAKHVYLNIEGHFPPKLDTQQATYINLLADKFLDHEFNFFGSGWRKLSGMWALPIKHANRREADTLLQLITEGYEPIPWHTDFLSGYRWNPEIHFTRIEFGHYPGADIKVPWELSRMQHLPILALDYGSTREKKRGDILKSEFQNVVLDFSIQNPPRFGVNWASSMDVAIRLINMLTAYHLYRAYGVGFGDQFERFFTRTVHEHTSHVFNNLEYTPGFRGNHYYINLVGLLCGALYLPQNQEVNTWIVLAIHELSTETGAQFGADGLNFEASTCYHRLTAEALLLACFFMKGKGRTIESAFREFAGDLLTPRHNRVPAIGSMSLTTILPNIIRNSEKIGHLSELMTTQSGFMPQIGDNDSGRVVKLDWPVPDGHEIDGIAAVPDDCDLRALISGFRLQSDPTQNPESIFSKVLRFVGGETTHSTSLNVYRPNFEKRQLKLPRMTGYSDFGLYVYHFPLYSCFVRCGPVGQNGRGGHAHNDQLSFSLFVREKPFIVDPGSYCYTSNFAQRNRFRSTAMHNTLCFVGREQNNWLPGLSGLFRLEDRANALPITVGENFFRGKHHGYGFEVRRFMEFFENEIVISEEYDLPQDAAAKNIGEAFVPIPLHPRVNLVPDSNPVKFQGEFENVALTAYQSETFRIEPSCYSPGYGEITKNLRIILEAPQKRTTWKILIS